jgi:lipoate---protein ligase
LTALSSSSTDPYANLALEECFLEGGGLAGGLVLLYANGPCAVIGRNQNPWIEVRADAGLPVLRRASGGGAVYHDLGNLNWSLVVAREEHDRCAELGIVVAALSTLGVEAEADGRGALRIAGAGPRSGDKVSGSARRMLRDRVLHHGTLLVESDLERMESCLGGIGAASSAAPPSAPSRVANLSSLIPGLRVCDAMAALALAFSGRAAESAEGRGLEEASLRAEARLRSWEWTYGATPPFYVLVGKGGTAASLEARGGIVRSVSGPGAPALAALVGTRFGYSLPARAEELLALNAGGLAAEGRSGL